MEDKNLKEQLEILKVRVDQLDRQVKEDADSRVKADELERWKQLVPEIKRYYPK